MDKYKITYQGKEIEIERLPNGKFKIPPLGQFTKQGLGSTWLDDCRIPYESEGDKYNYPKGGQGKHANPMDWDKPASRTTPQSSVPTGRFPANLVVSDDVLNDGKVRKSGFGDGRPNIQKDGTANQWTGGTKGEQLTPSDSGSFSRYFDLDKWWAKTIPFLIVPKASKAEKNKGLEGLEARQHPKEHYSSERLNDPRMSGEQQRLPNKNYHPTCKPVKLMSYLITLGSREGDVVLDNFGGSGTTGVAAKLLGRHCIMYEIDESYCEIAAKRCSQQALL